MLCKIDLNRMQLFPYSVHNTQKTENAKTEEM